MGERDRELLEDEEDDDEDREELRLDEPDVELSDDLKRFRCKKHPHTLDKSQNTLIQGISFVLVPASVSSFHRLFSYPFSFHHHRLTTLTEIWRKMLLSYQKIYRYSWLPRHHQIICIYPYHHHHRRHPLLLHHHPINEKITIKIDSISIGAIAKSD